MIADLLAAFIIAFIIYKIWEHLEGGDRLV